MGLRKGLLFLSIKGLVVAALLVALVVWRLDALHRLDLESLEGRSERTEAEQLFERLRDERLLTVDANGQLSVAPRDHVLAQRAAGADAGSLKLASRLIDNYYGTDPGRTLGDWIAQWNRGRLLSAVRDDRPRMADTPAAEWTPFDGTGSPLRGYGRVPLEFGFVMNGVLTPGFGDWTASPEQAVEWRSELHLAKGATLTLQVIGRPDTSRLSRHQLLACVPDVPAGQPNCAEGSVSGQARAYQIRLTLPAGHHSLRLPVAPVANPEPEDRDLPLALKAGRIEWVTRRERYSRGLAPSRPPASFVVRTADGQLLTGDDGKGRPTDFALKNGLAALLGYGTDYRGSLSGILAGSAIGLGGEVRLTLDSKLQAIAQAELERRLGEEWGAGDAFHNERRGAVVMLDARTGAVLAAANHPSPPDGTSLWDRAAFSVTWPNRDPFRFNPWQGLDAHATPGSTFKVVTSLAAIKAAGEGRDDVAAMLRGWGASAFERNTGLSSGASCYQPRGASEVCNFEGGSLAGAFGKALRNAACQPGRHSSGLGVREAVRDSLNIWYVRLGELMDRGNLQGGGVNTTLAALAGSLGFGKRLSLFQSVGATESGDAEPLIDGAVLRAMTGDLDLFHTKLGAPMQRLSQNSFGQGVRATPLQMARMAAAAATGSLVHPTLLANWEGRAISPKAPEALGLDEELLGLLRQGMKAVPETGTAAGVFNAENPGDRCRTYGKTGTAQSLEHPKLYSGWMIGWRDDKAQRPDIAFACVLTHSTGGTGGDLCGRVVARILKQWDR